MNTPRRRGVPRAIPGPRRLLTPAFFLVILSAGFCEPFEAGYSLTLTAENIGIHKDIFFEENRGAIGFESGPIALGVDFSLMGGRRYGPHTSYQMGRYFLINDASVHFEYENTNVYAGFFPHGDIVQTPYSIYISSVDIPALNAGFSYIHDRFFYETRWIRLNERSSVEYIGNQFLKTGIFLF